MIKPTHYTIRIEPDFETFKFRGVVYITIQADEPVQEIMLNAKELDFHACSINEKIGEMAIQGASECEAIYDAGSQQVIIYLPRKQVGKLALTLSYSGHINDQYAGFYRSRYWHQGQEKYMASTQFEASDARRAFPCFDQPGLKATFDIELVIDQELTGISNSALLDEVRLEKGLKLVRFERTPKMSTYLVFFGIGEFDFLVDNSTEPVVRVAVSPGKQEYGRYALDIGRKSLQFGEEYLEIPYPLSKCDFIAMPDSMGAMENFGAIRHAEDVLLFYPGITSKSRKTLITKIIAHETIHMWFGDLVSPAAWKYLWLNEAFATYFTYVIPHHYYPEWGVWEQFFTERLASGMERDSLSGSLPIDLPNVDNPNADPAPTPSTAPIVYNKGAAVIRMLAAYLGEDRFRQALHDYLCQYKFKAASSEQFWASVESSSGMSVRDFAVTWIHQAGYPLITVEPSDGVLNLTQQRFCYSEPPSESAWVIPVDLLFYLEDGSTQISQVILHNKSMAVELPENCQAYKLNAGFTGFYRVQYPENDLRRLGELISSHRLSGVDSLNVIDDSFALVKAGLKTVDAYLTFLENYCKDEYRYLPLTNLAKNLKGLYQINSTKRDQISKLGLPIFERAIDQMKWEPQDDEPLVITELRESLLWATFILGSERVASFVTSVFQRYLQGETIHKDISAIVLKIGAAISVDAWPHLWAIAIDSRQVESERISALEALGNNPDRDRLLALLDKNLTEIPTSLQSYMIQACGKSRIGPDLLWNWFCDNLHRFESRPLSVVERLIVGIVPRCGLENQQDVAVTLSDFIQRHPHASDSVEMALELLAANERLRRN